MVHTYMRRPVTLKLFHEDGFVPKRSYSKSPILTSEEQEEIRQQNLSNGKLAIVEERNDPKKRNPIIKI